MSQRIYKKEQQRVIIESLGDHPKSPDEEDIWNVTVVLEVGTEIRSILWTSQVKDLIAQIEQKDWKKEGLGEKETA